MAEPKVEQTNKPASYKRIILCADGTWLNSDSGQKAVPSNVAKLARAISRTGIDKNGDTVEQIVLYHPGLGTGDLPFQAAIYGGLGWGLDNDVCQIYDFISNNYDRNAGDELFFFGFSRGAFTARSVAGLVTDIGILSPVNMKYFPAMWREYRRNTSGQPFSKTKWFRDHKSQLDFTDIKIKVIGVWDTVGALGIPNWPLVELSAKLGYPLNKQYAFHNTRVSPNVDYAFQALAMDEKRLTFPPTLWHKSENSPAKRLEQCWFPGVHGNIGGQGDFWHAFGDHEEIGDNTFAWMVDNLSQMLTFDKDAITDLVHEHSKALDGIKPTNGWGCGPIIDNFTGLQGAFFRLLGRQDRTPGEYPRDPGDGTDGATNEFFHPTVRMRRYKVTKWNPPPLQGYELQEPDANTGWKWSKDGKRPVPEYEMKTNKTMSLAVQDPYDRKKIRFVTGESLSRKLCPTDILSDLDRDNANASRAEQNSSGPGVFHLS
ncbi:hypothetical protein PFICI_01832 [Pestalotiopsis fici W106-1]|uniref:T6SS Phospholipase effector Tle1-like catalytic domain-containing protein n=1 Tax=Pestalotiopsis fici (strain W106-1 / CGMCC3.15140) TaxID=1229662 RepID=W3XPU2_PESFW|nr:uncharacterized protein PFICI_01832 [Pestalotiopsis fici W106-1]ETS88004.1 hypothetical protein PFICI_01832 [Pestalotiopsis fici W106-1]